MKKMNAFRRKTALVICLSGLVLVGATLARAVTFDSDLLPAANNSYQLGAAAGDWKSVNATMYFSGSNVGIGITSPSQALEVNGGLRLNTTMSQPTCSAATRATFWIFQGGGGIKDPVGVCVKNASDTYLWATIY